MRSREVFSFIQGMYADGTLPAGRNMWGVAYNVDQYPAAIKAAARRGMDEERLVFWLKEYARRSKPGAVLMLPVVVRWGESERPRRTQVEVPMYAMKDFDSLPTAAEAALLLAADADADAEVYMRDMRAPDVPEVWARIVLGGLEKEVQFNPLKMWRGEVKLCEGWCDLKQVHVQEWCVVEKEAKVRRTQRAQAEGALVMHARAVQPVQPVQAALPPVPQPRRRRRKGSQESRDVALAVVLAAVALVLFWMMVR